MPLPALLPLITTAGTVGANAGAAAGTNGPGKSGDILSSLMQGVSGALTGNPVGALAGAKGLVQGIKSRRMQNSADGMFPEQEDPELRALLSTTARRKRAYQTGTALEPQMANMRALAKTGVNAAFRAGGGASGLNRINQILRDSMVGMSDAALKGEMFYAGEQRGLTENLAQTKLEKQLLKYNQQQAEAKSMKTASNRNFNLALAKTLNLPESDPNGAYTVPNTNQGAETSMNPNL
jgi:hypothetical protein